MARSHRPEGPTLFDLPLQEPEEDGGEPLAEEAFPAATPPRATPPRATPPSEAPLMEAPPAGGFAGEDAWLPLPPSPVDREEDLAEPPAAPGPPSLGDRFRAGFADLAVHAAVALAVLVGAELLGARPGVWDLPALALFLLVFSFLYSVVPLAFWGQTPGMIWAGLFCRGVEGYPLTFRETLRRWLGGLLTVALLGLPTLLAVGGRPSLTDRLSHSRTWAD